MSQVVSPKETEKQIIQNTLNRSGMACAANRNKLITLSELRESLKIIIRDADAQAKEEQFWTRILVAAKFTKATTDLILSVAGEFDSRVKLLATAQGVVTAHIESGTAGSSRKVAEALLEYSGQKDMKIAYDEIKKREDMVIDAVKGDLDGKKVIKYSIDTKIDAIEKVGESTRNKKLKKIAAVAKEVNGYVFMLSDLYNEWENSSFEKTGSFSGKKTAIKMLHDTDNRIAALEVLAQDCEVPEFQSLTRLP